MPTREASTYSHIFERYVCAGLRQSLRRVQSAAARVPEGDRQQAWHVLSYGLTIGGAWAEARDLLLSLSPMMEQAGFRDDWISYLTVGFEQAQAQGEPATQGEIAIQLGLLNQLASRYDESIRWLACAVAAFTQIEDPHHLGVAYNLLANVAIQQRHPHEAEMFVEKALATLPDDDPERAYTAYVQGDIALFTRNFKQAEIYFRRGLHLRRQQGDSRRIAMALRNLALALEYLERHDEAIACSAEAIQRFEELGDIRNLATVRVNLSILYYNLGEWDQALALLAQAELAYHKTRDEQSLAQLLTNRAIYQRKAGLLAESEASGREAIARWERLGDCGNVVNSLEDLGLCLVAQRRYLEAAQIFEQGLALLPRIEGHPRYNDYESRLRTHLAEVYRQMSG
jgi:tetratricopeptide (TPR) repeat protein